MNKPDFPHFIDSTMRKDLIACGAKFNYSHLHHYKPKGFSIHLHFGGCFAHGIENFRKAYYGKDGKSFDESLAIGVHSIIKNWGDAEPPEFGSGRNKTLEACIVALYEFFIQWPPDRDPIKPMMIDGDPAVEFTFALPIPGLLHPQTGTPILYTGRFDMLASFRNSVYINDEKTASQLGDSWQTNWELASQITGYMWASAQFGYKPQGAIIRGVCILTKEIKFALVLQRRTEWMIDRWLHELKKNVNHAIEQWKTDDWDYALDDACSSYNGCPYLGACTTKEPQKIFDIDFEVRPWNPLIK